MKFLPHSLLSVLCLQSPALLAQDAVSFTQEQADAGRAAYRESCQICHGSTLANGQFGTPLRGNFFREKWKGKSIGELQQFMFEKMPPDKIMTLTPGQSANLTAFILSRNDLVAGSEPLSGDYREQMQLMLPW
ncbi:MAG TPA: cytochrome c [Pseudomonadales bacterium]